MTEQVKITSKCLQNLERVFSSQKELEDFQIEFLEIAEELDFMRKLEKRTENRLNTLHAEALIPMAFFFLQNIDVIQDLVRALEFKVVQKKAPGKKKPKS